MSIIGMQKLTVKKIAQIGAVIACLGRGGTRTGEEKEKADFMCQLASLSLSLKFNIIYSLEKIFPG